jgi:hypothetical protein
MIEPTMIRHHPFSGQVTVKWAEDGRFADVYFLTDDRQSFVLTMPVEIVDLLRVDIARALADRPQPNLNH